MTSVYISGSGDCGQLGMGEDLLSCPKPLEIKFFSDKKIISVASGGLHSLALSEDGLVYSWGCNDDCAVGHLEPEFSIGRVPLNEKIVKIACGDSISVAVSETGKTYTWGTFRDSSGILSHRSGVKIQNTPIETKLENDVVCISAGANHVMAVTSKEKIYSWGVCQQGRLGRRISERHKINGLLPENVAQNKLRASLIACGSYHSLCVDNDGALYSCGLNNFGQLGHGDLKERFVFERCREQIYNKIVSVSAGEHHSLVLDVSGNVYSFGRGDYGQLGNKSLEKSQDGVVFSNIPIQVELNNISAVSAGGAHSLAIANNGKAYSWGYGEMGQLGLGNEEDSFIPQQVPIDKEVVQVSGGGQHSLFLTKHN